MYYVPQMYLGTFWRDEFVGLNLDYRLYMVVVDVAIQGSRLKSYCFQGYQSEMH